MKGSSPGFGELKKLHQRAVQAQQRAQAARAHDQVVAPSAEDAQWFRRAMQAVTPLSTAANATRASLPRAVAVPPSSEQLAKRRAATGETVDTPLSALSDHFSPPLRSEHGIAWCAPDMASDTPRRLQRGQWPVQARIDLHGLRTDAAREALAAFLADCLAHRLRCVRVIHGKGYGSTGNEPVLRKKTPAWLMQHSGVCAFVQTARAEGGEGALWVLLRLAQR